MRVRRGIIVDSTGLAIGGLAAGIVGLVAGMMLLTVVAAVIMLTAAVLWSVRMTVTRYRERRTPTMLFVSVEGVSAIMPDAATVSMVWPEISAHEARFRPGLLVSYDNVYQREEGRGLLLEGGAGKRLYLTRDLDGFADLLEVLAELDVPLSSIERLPGLRVSRPDALERRIW